MKILPILGKLPINNIARKRNFANKTKINLICGQNHNHFTSINYNPRVVIWAIF